MKAITCYLGRDDASLATPEYIEHKAEAESSRKQPMCPLWWHLMRELGPLDECDQEPPSKRTCTAGAGGEHVDEESL